MYLPRGTDDISGMVVENEEEGNLLRVIRTSEGAPTNAELGKFEATIIVLLGKALETMPSNRDLIVFSR